MKLVARWHWVVQDSHAYWKNMYRLFPCSLKPEYLHTLSCTVKACLLVYFALRELTTAQHMPGSFQRTSRKKAHNNRVIFIKALKKGSPERHKGTDLGLADLGLTSQSSDGYEQRSKVGPWIIMPTWGFSNENRNLNTWYPCLTFLVEHGACTTLLESSARDLTLIRSAGQRTSNSATDASLDLGIQTEIPNISAIWKHTWVVQKE